jgi:glycosyltransferase involved in cell wall biosynthesis
MKIAIISSGFLPVVDGVTINLLNRVKILSQKRHQVLLFCPDYSALESVYPNWQSYTGNILPGVRVINLESTPLMDLDFERNVNPDSYKVLLKELQDFQPDIIHVDEPERLQLGFFRRPAIDFAEQTKTPCVAIFHTNLVEYLDDYFSLPAFILKPIQALLRIHTRWVYNAYDRTLVYSQSTYEKITKHGIKNAINGDFVGVDLKQFNPELRTPNFFETAYRIPDLESKFKLLFLGRLTPDKGWKFTLNAFTKVAQMIDLNTVALLIAGDGPLQEEIAQRLKSFTSNVHMLGRVPPDQVPALLANSDVHVTTSEKETRGLTVLEAFACGVPVLASRSPGIIDSIQDGVNGLLFTPQDPTDFAMKLKRLVDDPDVRQRMGKHGRDYISHYGWEVIVENLLRIWEEQIQQKKQSFT